MLPQILDQKTRARVLSSKFTDLILFEITEMRIWSVSLQMQNNETVGKLQFALNVMHFNSLFTASIHQLCAPRKYSVVKVSFKKIVFSHLKWNQEFPHIYCKVSMTACTWKYHFNLYTRYIRKMGLFPSLMLQDIFRVSMESKINLKTFSKLLLFLSCDKFAELYEKIVHPKNQKFYYIFNGRQRSRSTFYSRDEYILISLNLAHWIVQIIGFLQKTKNMYSFSSSYKVFMFTYSQHTMKRALTQVWRKPIELQSGKTVSATVRQFIQKQK